MPDTAAAHPHHTSDNPTGDSEPTPPHINDCASTNRETSAPTLSEAARKSAITLSTP